MLFRFCLYLLLFGHSVQFLGQIRDIPLTKNPDSIPRLQVVSEYEPSTLLKGMEFTRPELTLNKTKDTINLNYKIRPASLSIPYETIRLNPLAYEVVKRPNEYVNYFSIYSGNTFIRVPKMRLSLGFGNGGNKNFRVYVSHIAEKGYIPRQKYRNIEWKALGQITPKAASFRFGIMGSWLDYYRYGVVGIKGADTLSATHLRNLFQHYLGFLKTDIGLGALNLNFSTQLGYSLLGVKSQELSTRLQLTFMPRKVYNSKISWFWNMGYKSNFLSQKIYPPKTQDTLNQLLFAEGQFSYQHKNIGLSTLFNVSYALHQKKLYYLPQIYFYYKVNQDIARLHLGWESELKMHNLVSLFKQNYFLSNQDLRYTTTYNQKWFIGGNGSWKNRLDYSLQLFYLQHRDMPLFVNKQNEPYSFSVYPVARLRSLGLAGTLNYNLKNRLKINTSFENNNYIFKGEEFYGLSPLVFRSSLTWLRVLKILTFKLSAVWKMGANYRLLVDKFHSEDGFEIFTVKRLPNYTDLSLLLKIRVAHFLELYTELHNIFHRQNPLWLYYNEMPFSVGGGVIFHFRTKALVKDKLLPAS